MEDFRIILRPKRSTYALPELGDRTASHRQCTMANTCRMVGDWWRDIQRSIRMCRGMDRRSDSECKLCSTGTQSLWRILVDSLRTDFHGSRGYTYTSRLHFVLCTPHCVRTEMGHTDSNGLAVSLRLKRNKRHRIRIYCLRWIKVTFECIRNIYRL